MPGLFVILAKLNQYMLLASCASLLVTAGLAIYDYAQKRNGKSKDKDDSRERRGSQSIKILLTGGPYLVHHIGVEAKAKESTASITPSKALLPPSSSSQKQLPSLELRD